MRVDERPGSSSPPDLLRTTVGRSCVVALLLSALLPLPAAAQGALNDTGLRACYDAGSQTGSTEPADFPRQDCRMGRDAAAAAKALPKTGAGTVGFDFTKISNAGAVLPASAAFGSGASDWACTFDNTTGLMWELKSPTTSDLRYAGNSYTWYSTDSLTNGGNQGYADGGFCVGGIPCDTESFVNAVNAAGLCGHSDWRMPTLPELTSVIDYSQPYGGSQPAIAPGYFPNTPFDDAYWTATTSAASPSNAYYVYFDGGYTVAYHKDDDHYVRLVRVGR